MGKEEGRRGEGRKKDIKSGEEGERKKEERKRHTEKNPKAFWH